MWLIFTNSNSFLSLLASIKILPSIHIIISLPFFIKAPCLHPIIETLFGFLPESVLSE